MAMTTRWLNGDRIAPHKIWRKKDNIETK